MKLTPTDIKINVNTFVTFSSQTSKMMESYAKQLQEWGELAAKNYVEMANLTGQRAFTKGI